MDPTIVADPKIVQDPRIEADPVQKNEEDGGGMVLMELVGWIGFIFFIVALLSVLFHFLFQKCNCPKISKAFKFIFLLCNIGFLCLNNINNPEKILEILSTAFSNIFKNDPPENDELLPLLALPSPQ